MISFKLYMWSNPQSKMVHDQETIGTSLSCVRSIQGGCFIEGKRSIQEAGRVKLGTCQAINMLTGILQPPQPKKPQNLSHESQECIPPKKKKNKNLRKSSKPTMTIRV
jgi:hypothetical protein